MARCNLPCDDTKRYLPFHAVLTLLIGAVTLISTDALPTSKTGECLPLDLSHPFDENTIYWISMQPFRFTRKIVNDPERGDDGIFYTANEFQAGEHGGTHLDAPYHFNKKGWKVGDIPIDRLVSVDGIILNAQKEVSLDSNYALTLNKLTEWEKEVGGQLVEPAVIIINYGWAKKIHNKNEYYGSQTFNITDLHFPGVSKEAAEWIANNEKIIGVGLDSPSVDSGPNSVNPVAHVTITEANKFILENLALDDIRFTNGRRFKLSISPMKIREGTGAPCRVFAIPAGCI